MDKFPLEIVLEEPVSFGGDLLEKITLSKPLTGNLRAIKSWGNPVACCLELASDLSGLPGEVIDRLSLEDGDKLVSILHPLLLGSRKTG
ncbi:phage tail assembly protein [uncultured Deefgea sp.]|uniref:phage tail assembly protein n=1 Tax=uncultured Deefgea sp. TaxID=1304914 RepID=UPI002593EDC9|nr:phage tail assembly protein [uncultured Deefgea sp.]